MTHLDALAEAWGERAAPSPVETLAQKCHQCPVGQKITLIAGSAPTFRVEQRHHAPLELVPSRVPFADADLPDDLIDALSSLTDREVQVITLLASGLTCDQAGAKLFISGDTVKSHRCRIYTKLDVHSAAQLGVIAARAGLA